MKVLVSAKACSPYQGSESYFGWSAVKCLAQDHELCVITGSRLRSELERAKTEGLVPPNVRFFHVGEFKEFHPNRLLAKVQDWKEYMRFSKEILPVAQELHRAEKFDVVRHVTFATWRWPHPCGNWVFLSCSAPSAAMRNFPFACSRC